MSVRSLLIVALLCSGALVQAHTDTSLRIDASGQLYGLPAEYSPATLDVRFEDWRGHRTVAGVTLTVGERSTELPGCIFGLLDSPEMSHIRAHASWYHDGPLPPYLAVTFFDEGYEASRFGNGGFHILFGLQTARVIDVIALIARDDGTRFHRVYVDLAKQCGEPQLRDVVDQSR